jgi:hypothetical protein
MEQTRMTKKTDLQIDMQARAAAVTRAREIARKLVRTELRAWGYKPRDRTWEAATRMYEGNVKFHLEKAAADPLNFPDFVRNVAAVADEESAEVVELDQFRNRKRTI